MWGPLSSETEGGGAVATLLFLPEFKTNLTEMSNRDDDCCHELR